VGKVKEKAAQAKKNIPVIVKGYPYATLGVYIIGFVMGLIAGVWIAG